ncbi:MAG TPA: hypothetical protein VGY98_00745 [Verrucomicrobiae bacterium]|nr:hypothetical protein [Verrucomicrobiae bacterium]
MSKMHQTKLYPGETNQLRLIAEQLRTTFRMINLEVERLGQLRSNPTFPTEHFREHIEEIGCQARGILEIVEGTR